MDFVDSLVIVGKFVEVGGKISTCDPAKLVHLQLPCLDILPKVLVPRLQALLPPRVQASLPWHPLQQDKHESTW